MDKNELLDEIVDIFIRDDAPDWVRDLVRAELEKIAKEKIAKDEIQN